MSDKVTGTNFWHQRHLEPKRKFRWVATIGQGKKLFTYLVKTVNKPTFSTAVAEHKILGHTFKYPGPATWSDLELDFIELAGSEGDSRDGNGALFLMDLIHASGYVYPETLNNAKVGITKARASAALGTVKVDQLDGAGRVLETYKYHNPFVQEINFGDLSYEDEDISSISLTISYDWARIIDGTSQGFNALDGTGNDQIGRKGLNNKSYDLNIRPKNKQ